MHFQNFPKGYYIWVEAELKVRVEVLPPYTNPIHSGLPKIVRRSGLIIMSEYEVFEWNLFWKGCEGGASRPWIHAVYSNCSTTALVTFWELVGARLVLALFLVIRFMPNLDAVLRVYDSYSSRDGVLQLSSPPTSFVGDLFTCSHGIKVAAVSAVHILEKNSRA